MLDFYSCHLSTACEHSRRGVKKSSLLIMELVHDSAHFGVKGTQVHTDPPSVAPTKSRVYHGPQVSLKSAALGHVGWHVVDGEEQSVLPLLHRVNDPRGTPLAPHCTVSEL